MSKKILYKYPFLGSSVNPEKLALTVKGILVGLIPLVIIVAKSFNINLGTEELNNIVEAVSTSVLAIGAAVSAVMTLWGLIRKIINKKL